MHAIQFHLTVLETGSDEERLDDLTVQLLRQLRDLDTESVKRLTDAAEVKQTKGDPLTWGALVLVAMPAVLHALADFLQSWVVERRKIVLEAPNGAKLEFVPGKKYSEAELLAFIAKMNEIEVSADKAVTT